MTRLGASRWGGWPLRGVSALLGTALALVPQAAAASSPTVTVSPDSGGPGVQVTLRGSGFCGAASCGTVTVTMGGFQVAGGIRPGTTGAFTSRVVVPGGLAAGQVYLIARQVHDDGNEAQAMVGFVYSPSKGEAAERKAAESETLQQLLDPTRPAAARGVPLASVAPQAPSAKPLSAGLPSVQSSLESAAATRTHPGDRRWPLAAAVGAALGLAALALLARRRGHLRATWHLRR